MVSGEVKCWQKLKRNARKLTKHNKRNEWSYDIKNMWPKKITIQIPLMDDYDYLKYYQGNNNIKKPKKYNYHVCKENDYFTNKDY